jgi:hypothetical protein
MAQPNNAQYVSDTFSTNMPLVESKGAVHQVVLECRLADGGKGTLILDPNIPRFNEFGDPVANSKRSPEVRLDCTLRLIKKEKGRQLYDVRGPKIVSRLSLAVYELDSPWGDARLLVHGMGGEVRYVIGLNERTHRLKPCHPGCFPAGTKVRVPGGTKLIRHIRAGDLVTTIDADGKPSSTKVLGLFVTQNRLLEVRTEGGNLLTTETQPVACADGRFQPAGSLRQGDRVWRWVGGKRQAVAVLGVSPAQREASVFNLILGKSNVFIADDFLVRSKPPAVQALPAGASISDGTAPDRGRR